MIGLILFNPQEYTAEALKGFEVWYRFVLPALFPFFYITKLLTSLGMIERIATKCQFITSKLFNAPPITAHIMLMSYLSGYPIGAKLIGESYDNGFISKEDGEKISILCSSSGLIFIVGTIGGLMLNAISIGIAIYVAHLLSCVFMGIVMGRKKKVQPSFAYSLQVKNYDDILGETIYSSVISILIVGGYISLFYMVFHMIDSTQILLPLEWIINQLLSPIVAPSVNVGGSIIQGLFEATQGCSSVSLIDNKVLAGGIMCGIITFGGFSINLQAITYLSKAKIKPMKYLFRKVIQSAVAVSFYSIIAVIFF